MRRITARLGKVCIVSDAVAGKVAVSASRVLLSRNEALAIAAAEPRGATVFAGPTSRRSTHRGSKPDKSFVKR